MIEDEDSPPIIEEAGREIAGDFDRRGTLMIEADSYDRVIEGMKMAADGARHLSPWRDDEEWDRLAGIMDALRLAFVKLARMNRPGDDRLSNRKDGGLILGPKDSYERVYNGLGMASTGARQIAVCHRGDMRWSALAAGLEKLRDKCGETKRQTEKQWNVLLN